MTAKANAQTKPAYDATLLPMVVGRTTALPIETVRAILASENPLDALRELFQRDPLARQAVFVASPALAAAIDDWIAGKPLRNEAAPLRALAYVARMSSRPTPLGIFAGIGCIEVGESTSLQIDSLARRTYTRPDMGFLSEVLAELERGERRQMVRYVTNAAALERGGRLYVTNVALANYVEHGAEQRPVSLKHTAAVSFVRDIARGPAMYSELATRLSGQFDASVEDAERVLDTLIEAGVLLSELRASPIGDPVRHLAEACDRIDPVLGAQLRFALGVAAALDEQPLHERQMDSYAAMIEAYASLSSKPVGNVAQVDLHVPFSGTLNAQVLNDVALLGEFSIRMGYKQSLTKFRDRFVQRYEGTERMVPLLELVDPGVGLGMPEPMDMIDPVDDERDALLMRIASDALRSGAEEVEIDERDFAKIAPPLQSDADISSLDLGFQIAAASAEAIDRGEYLVVPSGFSGVRGAGRSFGRFMHLFSQRERDRARAIAGASQAPGTIAAEFAFVPPITRYYNVSTRPAVLDTEIRVGIGGPESTNELALDDLWVGLDAGRFFLWSHSRQRRVTPVENHLFNTIEMAPNICRFLSQIGGDGRTNLRGIPWGRAAGLTYLPRIRVGRVVLSPRRWRFTKGELGESAGEVGAALARWRAEWKMPRYVNLVEADQLLMLDLASPITPELLLDQIGEKAPTIELTEVLPAYDQLWVEGDRGKHTVEFVAALLPREAPAAPLQLLAPKAIVSRARAGYKWVYLKCYTGSQAFEDLVLRSIAPLVDELRMEFGLKRWFFVRYADPQHHLRVRFAATEDAVRALRERVLDAAEELLGTGRISRYTLETYDPEYERYGGVAQMDAAESFFTFDSDACVDSIGRVPDQEDARIEAAAESFGAWLGSDAGLVELALEAFAQAAKRKLTPADRDSLKRLNDRGTSEVDSGLADALIGDDRAERLRSLFHMHANRLGVTPNLEPRAVTLLRTLLLARRHTTRARPLLAI